MILSKKATSLEVARKRLGVSLVGGYLPARIEQPRAKFVGGARKRSVSKISLVTSWPTNSKVQGR
jgi:hypothetical protein